MKTKISALLAAIAVSVLAVGCKDADNRTVTPDEVKKANANSMQQIEKLNIPEASKKELESHMGGAPYSNPAMEAAKAHGVKVAPGGRQQ